MNDMTKITIAEPVFEDTSFLQQMLTIVVDYDNDTQSGGDGLQYSVGYLRKMLESQGINTQKYDYCPGSGPGQQHEEMVVEYDNETCCVCKRKWGE